MPELSLTENDINEVYALFDSQQISTENKIRKILECYGIGINENDITLESKPENKWI